MVRCDLRVGEAVHLLAYRAGRANARSNLAADDAPERRHAPWDGRGANAGDAGWPRCRARADHGGASAAAAEADRGRRCATRAVARARARTGGPADARNGEGTGATRDAGAAGQGGRRLDHRIVKDLHSAARRARASARPRVSARVAAVTTAG